jgi:urocanate hydratase
MAGDLEQAANAWRQYESIQSKIEKLGNSLKETLTILRGI